MSCLTQRLKAAMDSRYIQENTDEVIELLCEAVAEIERIGKLRELAVREREIQYKSYFHTVNQLNEANAEIERLKGICESYALQYGTVRDKEYIVRKAKTEAVKTVVSRLKDSLEGKTEPIDDYDLDEVEQEMMEEING